MSTAFDLRGTRSPPRVPTPSTPLVRSWAWLLADLLALTAVSLIARQPLIVEFAYALGVVLTLAAGNLYRPRICLRSWDQVPLIAVAAVFPLVALVWWPQLPRLVPLSLGLLIGFRFTAGQVLRALYRRGLLAERALVLGADQLASTLSQALRAHPELGVRALGSADGVARTALRDDPVELSSLVARHRVSRVLVAFPALDETELVRLLRSCRELPVRVCLVPRAHEAGMAIPRGRMDEIWGIPLIAMRRYTRSSMLFKRVFDLVIGTVLALVALPALLALALVVRITTGRAFFRQLRVTRGRDLTEVVKLRTVRRDAPESWAVPTGRCPRVGRWLRSTHLDELPQLWHVLRGEMSLVGPRPERPYYAMRFAEEIPGYADRHRLPSGVTGWAQVNGLHGDTSIRDRARFDNHYIEYWSPWLDLIIVSRTVGIVAATILRSRPPRRPAGGREPTGQT